MGCGGRKGNAVGVGATTAGNNKSEKKKNMPERESTNLISKENKRPFLLSVISGAISTHTYKAETRHNEGIVLHQNLGTKQTQHSLDFLLLSQREISKSKVLMCTSDMCEESTGEQISTKTTLDLNGCH